ncbi:MAG: type II toxin-antitoxin system VapC family toxin [Alphaproteobacteria bacterium]
MRAIDTNVLVRLAVGDDARQLAAADSFLKGGVWVSHLVLAEACWVLDYTYDMSAEQIIGVVERLLREEDTTLQEPDVVEAALAGYRARPSVGFSDCLILEIARKAGHLPLGTFDRMLAKFEGGQLL